MRWLLLKDLKILKRSPLLVALLILYPIVISVLIGFALSRGPDKPKVAFVNLVPKTQNKVKLGGEQIDVSKYADDLFQAIDPVRVGCDKLGPAKCEKKAIKLVKDGDALAALVIPADATERLQKMESLVGTPPPTIRVYYNAEDPVKASYVENTIKSQVQDANAALTKKFTEVALSYLDLIVKGGTIDLPILSDVNILGLEKSEEIIAQAKKATPPKVRDELDRVQTFARLAAENLDLSNEVLNSIGTPLAVKRIKLNGAATPLSEFAIALAVAVSLMFITLLLAAGALALEREENAFLRLVRGLVGRTALLLEKAGLAAVCSTVICLLMLAGLGIFVSLDWGRVPLWIVATGAGALAFAALGLAIGALTRDVRASSLLCVMLSLPLAFLALVPSGAVSPALYDVVRAISAVFPFKATLDALDAAINDAGGLGGALLHLAALFAGFGVLARVALRRFA
ncbi:MAG: type transport system permease protein [Gaiellaceae bacterium]|jgi:ABC-2 type transport system permease protein|nr:type transport system permease protein [Gaiellaceae bacterium]